MKRVKIYPAFDALYYSFYLHGIMEVFGESNVEFSYRGFPSIPSDCLAFSVMDGGERRLAVDAYDGSSLNDRNALEWCDVYGKVNLVSSLMPDAHVEKCRPIGPSFAIRMWPLSTTFWTAIKHYRSGPCKSPRTHFTNYLRQYRDRLPLESFVPGSVTPNYIFFSSTIWSEEQAPGTNQYRASFFEVCKSLKAITFEGGFTRYEERFKEHVAPKRYPFAEWLEKIKSSVLVFNTPAVWLSHTWKLAEFLALGKAILSTPISRELPAPLVHGEHIHYVDGSIDSFREAIGQIIADREYRTHLERNAREYYLKYLEPKTVIERLVNYQDQDAREATWTRTAG
jgi:hypothetical protein